jgi:hypothetical protein
MRRLVVLAGFLALAAAWSGPALAAGAPVNVEPPVIVGRPDVGSTLTASAGTWTGSPGFTFQWQRCAPGLACVDIPGAIGRSYVVGVGDGGSTLQVVVTATDAGGETEAKSDPYFVVPTYTLSTPHFLVHYETVNGAAITETQAGDIGAMAERAYAAELADGYPPPLSDGLLGTDGRIDIYIADIAEPGVLAYSIPDLPLGAQDHGWIVLNGSNPAIAFSQHSIAHELFHLIQFGLWLPSSVSDAWLFEASAEWMGFKVDGFQVGTPNLGAWDMALDCKDPLGGVKCDLADGYRQNGYSRWSFFEYLSERWGPGFVRDVLARGPAAGSAVAALSDAIAAKGSTLSDVFTDWTVANLTGGYAVEALHVLPPAYGQPVATGSLASLNAQTAKGSALVTTGAIPPTTVAVNHLSARFVALRRGAALADTPCFAATLSLSVALPSGVGARPYLWWTQKKADGTNLQAAQPLAISGDTATITVPWDTCDWGATQAYLALPNPSTTLDAQDFRVTGTISIDRHTEATATPPPDPVSVHGQTYDAADASPAPRIEVYGPQLLRLAPGANALRLIVSSSGSGELQAALGSLSLGSARLRAGSNDVRFRLPASVFASARRTSAASSMLTLTPRSTSGATGTRVVRRVALPRPAAKPKPAKPTKPHHR